MTEPNNTPNDPSDQESLDDVLRGLSAEGSEEEQSLDDILASLSEDEPEDAASVPDMLDTDDLLASSIDDSIEPASVEPALPTSTPSEPEPPPVDVDVTPIGMESIESEQWVDETELALPVDTPVDTPEPIITENTDPAAEPRIFGQSDQPLSADSPAAEAVSGSDLEPSPESVPPEPEPSISFEIADTGSPSAEVSGAEVPSEASPFDPIPMSPPPEDAGSPFAAPVDDTPGATFADTSEAAPPADESVPESTAEPDPQLDPSPLPSMEDPAPLEGGDVTETPSPFEPPVTAAQDASEPPFSAPESDAVEPAFTSFASDPPTDAQPPEQTPEVPPLEGIESTGAEGDQGQAAEPPSTQASDPELSAFVNELSAFVNEPSPTSPDAPAELDAPVEPDIPAVAANQPEEPEPSAREPLELTDSDPDFSGPELPSLPPLAQPTFSRPSLSQASIDAPAENTPVDDAQEPLTLKTLLERPRHRWLVPFGFILILVLFGAIILGALRGNQESDPAPETQEQSLGLDSDQR